MEEAVRGAAVDEWTFPWGGTADVRVVLKKTTSSMHPEIPVDLILRRAALQGKGETRYNNKRFPLKEMLGFDVRVYPLTSQKAGERCISEVYFSLMTTSTHQR